MWFMAWWSYCQTKCKLIQPLKRKKTLMDDEKYWKEKIEAVIKISKKYGFPEQDKEFWIRQPAGIISLIIITEKGQ